MSAIGGLQKSQLTNFQEAVIHVMYIWETGMAKHSRDLDLEVGFNSAFFSELLGTKWQGYHYDAMIALEDGGWIAKEKTNRREIVYRLTPAARIAIAQHCALAAKYTRIWKPNAF